MARYKYIELPDKVICISTFAKKKVRGGAHCAPEDNFDLIVGKTLARFRCDEKIANKRIKRAIQKYDEAYAEFKKAKHHLHEMKEYWNDSVAKANVIRENRIEYEKKLGKNT